MNGKQHKADEKADFNPLFFSSALVLNSNSQFPKPPLNKVSVSEQYSFALKGLFFSFFPTKQHV